MILLDDSSFLCTVIMTVHTNLAQHLSTQQALIHMVLLHAASLQPATAISTSMLFANTRPCCSSTPHIAKQPTSLLHGNTTHCCSSTIHLALAGQYTEGSRSGQTCVAKWFKTGPVYDAVFFTKDVAAVGKAQASQGTRAYT